MNIKEHIEAGHYLKNQKGQPRIQLSGPGGMYATILSTDGPANTPIVGYTDFPTATMWRCDGTHSGTVSTLALLPPAPRKVKVTRWGVFEMRGGVGFITSYGEREGAERLAALEPALKRIIIPLTGEYEEPWS